MIWLVGGDGWLSVDGGGGGLRQNALICDRGVGFGRGSGDGGIHGWGEETLKSIRRNNNHHHNQQNYSLTHHHIIKTFL